MKKILFLLCFVMGMVPQANATSLLSLSSPEYLGTIADSQPADAAEEANYINYLISVSYPTLSPVDLNKGYYGEDYTPQDNNNEYTTFDVTGYDYLLGRYNNDSLVWYVGGIEGMVDLVLDPDGNSGDVYNSNSLSHISLYIDPPTPDNPSPVPEPATMLLLGTGLLGLARFRRRRKIK